MSSSPPSKRHQKQQHHSHIQPLAPQPQAGLASTLSGSSAESAGLAILSTPLSPSRKRKTMEQPNPLTVPLVAPAVDMGNAGPSAHDTSSTQSPGAIPAPKKSRTNTPWTPAEEKRLKTMRDAGSTWSEIAKTFPNRTEGSVKKHWYKDMHYADFAEDESAALLQAIRDYEANKWKFIGQKVGKPAKACEQYAKENFVGRI
ncbi:MAG: hypothetical protein MMC23_002505 [Stictis urceolatum]|nr:hypothetical protein [Stictis urceolata]